MSDSTKKGAEVGRRLIELERLLREVSAFLYAKNLVSENFTEELQHFLLVVSQENNHLRCGWCGTPIFKSGFSIAGKSFCSKQDEVWERGQYEE